MKKDHLKIAQDIADRANVNWAAASDDPLVRNLQQIAAIAGAFDEAAPCNETPAFDENAPVEALFNWGHLQVRELIAQGSFGEVYRAFDPMLERDVALKLRHSKSLSIPNTSYIQEARRLARIRHPNVLAVHGAGSHNNRVGLWCDLIEGVTLSEKLRQEGPLTADQALSFATGLSDALARVHEAGMVHCDVKSSNVMIGADGRIVLMDFGAGNDLCDEKTQETSFGTPLYMAPELFQDQSPQTACDIYSLGVLLFQMLSNSFPVQATTVPEIIAQHVRGHRRDLKKIKPGLPRHLTDLVNACLSSKPEDRPSATEISARLSWIVELPARRVKQRLRFCLIAALCLGLVFSSWGYVAAKRETIRTQQANNQAQATHDFLVGMLAAPAPINQGRDVRVLDVLETARTEIEPKFGNKPTLKASLMYTLGMTFGRLNDHETAREMLTASHDLQMELFGPLDARTLHSRFSLGETLLLTSNITAAEELLRPCLERCRKVLGTDHYLTSNAAIRVAQLLKHKMQFQQAESLLQEVLTWRISNPESESVKVLLATANLANLYTTRGRFSEASQLLQDLLAGPIGKTGGSNIIAAYTNLAIALIEQGKYSDAEVILRKNLITAREVLGPDHPSVFSTQSNLAMLLGRKGKPLEALTQLEEVRVLLEQKFGPEYSELLLLKMNMANLLRELDRRTEAEAIHREILPQHQKVYGEESPKTGLVLFNLAEILMETGRPAEGETLARQANTIFAKGHGPEHPFTLEAQSLIGVCYLEMGRVEEALTLLMEVFEAKQKALDENSPYLLDTLRHLAQAYAAGGQMDQARATAENAYERYCDLYGADHPKTMQARQVMIDLSLD